MLETLPTTSAVWFGGLACLLVAISVSVGSVRFAGSESREWTLERSGYIGALVVFPWVVFGVPLAFIFGGEGVYQEQVGSWMVIVGFLSVVFCWGVITSAYSLGSYWESVTAPLVFVLLASVPAFLLAILMGMVTIGVAFWVVLAATIFSLVAFLAFGVFGLLIFSPIVVMMIVAAIQA